MSNLPQINEGAFEYYARLRKVKLYIEEDLSREIRLEDAAQVAGIEKKYFSFFFRKKVGVCFRDWLMCMRIAEAKRLMTARNYSITQVAFKIGFADLRTFERAFKRLAGLTPRDFKKSVEPHIQ
jgi:two-component system response regulator YesN